MPGIEDLVRVMESVYAQIDARASEIEGRLPLHCRKGCCACCLDDLTVFQCEAEVIRHCCGDVLQEAPNAKGSCAFLDKDGACRIYSHRPYVCRTHGLPLCWLSENDEECRDICELNKDIDTEKLDTGDCWNIGPVEAHLSRVESVFFGENAGKRIKLRDLFQK